MRPAPLQRLALVLSGGGARGAFQAGVISGLAKHYPDLRFDVLTGVSAGAINAAYLACHPGPLSSAGPGLAALWRRLSAEEVFRVDLPWFARNMMRWGWRLISGGGSLAPEVRSLVDCSPLGVLIQKEVGNPDGTLRGIPENLAAGHLQAVGITTLDYSTGQTITWVEGRDVTGWRAPRRRSLETRLTVAHVMASAALPLFFPAVEINGHWHGDGGVRLSAPLAPALNLGATRILAVSPRYEPSVEEGEDLKTHGYPAPAQVLSPVMGAIFLDALDRDLRHVENVNRVLSRVPGGQHEELRRVNLVVLRPEVDLGRLAGGYETRLPRAFRFFTRSLGTRQSASPDSLSFLLFQPEYLSHLVDVGEQTVELRRGELAELLGRG